MNTDDLDDYMLKLEDRKMQLAFEVEDLKSLLYDIQMNLIKHTKHLDVLPERQQQELIESSERFFNEIEEVLRSRK